MSSLWIGVDPGDRWTGIATLYETKKHYEGGAFLVDGTKDLYLATDVVRGWLQTFSAQVVVEDFRTRPVGHQSWSRSGALRFVGALELIARDHAVRIYTVPPGPPRELRALGLDCVLDVWQPTWVGFNAQWTHAASAWRALARRFLVADPACVDRLRRLPRIEQVSARRGATRRASRTLLLPVGNEVTVAPFARWDRI